MGDVKEVIGDTIEELGDNLSDKEILTMVVIVEKKPKSDAFRCSSKLY
jgi:hypothetical protein